GLILAAGESSRMGQDKALLTYGDRTFLEIIVATLHEAGMERVVVVLGHHAEQIQGAVTLEGAEIVINRDYARGQTSSLQAGLRALESADLEAVVLCLVDHPLISADTVRALVASFRRSGAPVVIPTFQNQRGHPVLIGRALFSELLSLDPGEGANTVIRKYREATQFVEVDDQGILLDVDDAEAYRRLSET
ncbi:MAG: nucleotidyltransferase family protein, partial [Acidobacteriia bacterium]|nr:nucleotidyltransferase family protein [Terriglobia bacterium]